MDPIQGNSAQHADNAALFREMLAATGITPILIARFQKTMLSYYRKNGRDLPWRHTTDPYHILVSEIMLQQTQVDRVMRKYPEFLAAFPTCTDLARAPLGTVLAVWQGMGYNRRAIALKACAQKMVDDYGGRLPANGDALESFPGIGKATAHAIMAFAFNQPTVFIETNIRRVFIHFFFDGKEAVPDTEILPLVQEALYREKPRVWYSALMDYGTMLKNSVPNPNRRSLHYTKQSKFRGSDREIRGTVLKVLLQDKELEEDTVIGLIGTEPVRCRQILNGLIDEGFLYRTGPCIRIRDH